LSKDDINQMVKDAEANASADKEKRALIEARNKAEALAHEAEKNLKEHGDKVGEAERSVIESDIAAVRAVLESSNKEEIEAKANALTQSVMKLGEAIYKAQQSAGPAGATDAEATPADDATAAKPADGDVVDAHFEDISDDDKKAS
jgi:molecular chaperone DnaK